MFNDSKFTIFLLLFLYSMKINAIIKWFSFPSLIYTVSLRLLLLNLFNSLLIEKVYLFKIEKFYLSSQLCSLKVVNFWSLVLIESQTSVIIGSKVRLIDWTFVGFKSLTAILELGFNLLIIIYTIEGKDFKF